MIGKKESWTLLQYMSFGLSEKVRTYKNGMGMKILKIPIFRKIIRIEKIYEITTLDILSMIGKKESWTLLQYMSFGLSEKVRTYKNGMGMKILKIPIFRKIIRIEKNI